jgi:uncharacterized protein YciW
MTNFMNTVTLRAAKVSIDHTLDGALAGRNDIFTMTDQAHGAALTPGDPGGLSHGLRASLACRMARANAAEGLMAHFADLSARAGGAEAEAQVADPAFNGGEDVWLAAVVRHTDLVTSDAKSVVAKDIAALTAAGVSEDDIVRLSELIAFVNYQARVVVGLRLMAGLS